MSYLLLLYISITIIFIKLFLNYYIFNSKFNHKKILSNINTIDILNCIDNIDWSTSRAEINKIHSETKTINIIDIDQNILVDKDKYSPIFKFLDNFTKNIKGEIYSVNLIFLGKDKNIKPHIDGIRNNKKYTNYYDDKDRYHLVLSGSYNLMCDNEIKHYKTGDLWWFNNKKIHSVKANSDRIALIFDIKNI